MGRQPHIDIRPIQLSDIDNYRMCVDAVMRERQFLARLEGFTLEQTSAFVAHNLSAGLQHVFAVIAQYFGHGSIA